MEIQWTECSKATSTQGTGIHWRIFWKAVTSITQFCMVEEFNYCCLPVFDKRSCTVNDNRFWNMLKVLEPRCTPSDWTMFSRHYYTRRKKPKWVNKLHLGWTILYWQPIAGLHEPDSSLHLWSMEFLVSHARNQRTVVNLSNYLEEYLDRWKLQSTQVSAAVTDNASNITAAINRLEWQHFGCFSHTLQLKAISLRHHRCHLSSKSHLRVVMNTEMRLATIMESSGSVPI